MVIPQKLVTLSMQDTERRKTKQDQETQDRKLKR